MQMSQLSTLASRWTTSTTFQQCWRIIVLLEIDRNMLRRRGPWTWWWFCWMTWWYSVLAAIIVERCSFAEQWYRETLSLFCACYVVCSSSWLFGTVFVSFLSTVLDGRFPTLKKVFITPVLIRIHFKQRRTRLTCSANIDSSQNSM